MHAQIDEDAHMSEHGYFSVAINIWIEEHSLQLLYHELGHVKYVVPNFAVYSKFYKAYYERQLSSFSYVGHHAKDKSGRSAMACERKFIDDRACFAKQNGKKVASAIAVMSDIRKNNKNLLTPSDEGQWYTRSVAEH